MDGTDRSRGLPGHPHGQERDKVRLNMFLPEIRIGEMSENISLVSGIMHL